jgi:hypothetical protein
MNLKTAGMPNRCTKNSGAKITEKGKKQKVRINAEDIFQYKRKICVKYVKRTEKQTFRENNYGKQKSDKPLACSLIFFLQ